MEKAVESTAKQPAKAAGRKSAKRATSKKAVGVKRKYASRSSAGNSAAENGNGYSASASRLLSRGKSAIGDAYSWADEAGRALPAKARNMHLPDTRSMQNFVSERPLVIGALGLGIGIALGAMMPSAHHQAGRVGRKPGRK
jgi:hypothetical protein